MFNSDFPTVFRKVSLISVHQIKSAVYELIFNSTIKPCQYRVFIALHFKVVVGDVCRCISVLISLHCVKHSSFHTISTYTFHTISTYTFHTISTYTFIQYIHIPSYNIFIYLPYNIYIYLPYNIYIYLPYTIYIYLHTISSYTFHTISTYTIHTKSSYSSQGFDNSALPEGECTMCQILAWHTQIVTL